MAKGAKKPPPRVYHDGLIPTTHETDQNYPEVVPDDHDQVKHEKSYPELAPPQPSEEEQQQEQQQQEQQQQEQWQQQQRQQQQQQRQQQQIPSAIVTPPTAHGEHGSQQLSGLSPLPAPPFIHPLPLPRTSGVHSLRQAWSEVDDPEDMPAMEDRPPFWERPIFWVVTISLMVIIALAGVLGGVVTGGIKTAWDSNTSTSGQTTTPTPPSSVTNPTCPGSNNLNYTTTTSATSSNTNKKKTFRIQCDANYPGGDGSLGRQTAAAAVDSVGACLDACARQADCVGAVFINKPAGGGGDDAAAECWLKQFLGVVQVGTGNGNGGVVSGVLWQ
ncbi:hypothetical protein C8A00DRAFT_46874 [Chaetomidium leptoderma]|uniref:Apple domain-containing protein n=1 Tax=Chaetomidium leptoderma TaxID=669021 RepID=A0AAN6VEC4_9PEZI|nr:hypothetical protein C8A00DRAFT_46874 [Chaetomidium leptoderma]